MKLIAYAYKSISTKVYDVKETPKTKPGPATLFLLSSIHKTHQLWFIPKNRKSLIVVSSSCGCMFLHIHVRCYSNNNDGIYTVVMFYIRAFDNSWFEMTLAQTRAIRSYEEPTCAVITLLQACVLPYIHTVVTSVRHQDVLLYQMTTRIKQILFFPHWGHGKKKKIWAAGLSEASNKPRKQGLYKNVFFSSRSSIQFKTKYSSWDDF